MPLMGSVPTRPHDEAVQARIFKALHEVALAASGVLDPAELARLTIEHARTLLGGDTPTIARIPRTWTRLSRRSSRVGRSPPSSRAAATLASCSRASTGGSRTKRGWSGSSPPTTASTTCTPSSPPGRESPERPSAPGGRSWSMTTSLTATPARRWSSWGSGARSRCRWSPRTGPWACSWSPPAGLAAGRNPTWTCSGSSRPRSRLPSRPRGWPTSATSRPPASTSCTSSPSPPAEFSTSAPSPG